MVGSLARIVLAGLVGAAILSACSSGQPPVGGGDVDLSGTWLVEGTSPTFDVAGTKTVTFEGSTSGAMRFLADASDSGVTTCRTYVFAVVDDAVLFVESWQHASEAFVIASANATSVELESDASSLTLTRAAGDGPVDDCGVVDLEPLATLNGQPNSFTNLVAAGNTLYFNLDTGSDPIVGFDLGNLTFGAPRAFTVPVGGGTDRLVLAAASDDVFFGQCACGGSTRFSRFNVATNTHLAQVDSETDLGFEVSFRYGLLDAASTTLWVGGRASGGTGVNRLFGLDATTLVLTSQREILPGESINDLATMDGRLFALLGSAGAVAEVGADGRAVATWKVPRNAVGGSLRGLEAVGGTMYLLVDDWVAGRSVLSTIDLQ